MSRTNDSARLRSATPRQRTVIVVALIAIPVLLLALVVSRLEATGHVVEAGDGIEMTEGVHSGTTHAVRLPTSTVAVRVGEPVDEVDPTALDVPTSTEDHTDPDAPVRPEVGYTLLPVTWVLERDRESAGTEDMDGQDVSGRPTAEADETPVDVTLIVDDEEHDLVDERQVQSVIDDGRESLLLPVRAGAEAADITVEVTYDGLTQTLSPESGAIDKGAAEPLYDAADDSVFDTSCDDDPCRFESDPDSEWQPAHGWGSVELGRMLITPHDPTLGWADEGKAWASVDVRLSGLGSFYDDEGERRGAKGLPTVGGTLDGVRGEAVTPDSESSLTSEARVNFQVPAEATPKKLKLTYRTTLAGNGQPRTGTVHEEITVR